VSFSSLLPLLYNLGHDDAKSDLKKSHRGVRRVSRRVELQKLLQVNNDGKVHFTDLFYSFCVSYLSFCEGIENVCYLYGDVTDRNFILSRRNRNPKISLSFKYDHLSFFVFEFPIKCLLKFISGVTFLSRKCHVPYFYCSLCDRNKKFALFLYTLIFGCIALYTLLIGSLLSALLSLKRVF